MVEEWRGWGRACQGECFGPTYSSGEVVIRQIGVLARGLESVLGQQGEDRVVAGVRSLALERSLEEVEAGAQFFGGKLRKLLDEKGVARSLLAHLAPVHALSGG